MNTRMCGGGIQFFWIEVRPGRILTMVSGVCNPRRADKDVYEEAVHACDIRDILNRDVYAEREWFGWRSGFYIELWSGLH